MTFPTSTPCWFDSTEAGAPTLNNAPGSLLAVLRACLITGFGVRAVSSIVVASGVATVTAAAHGFSAAYGKLVLIDGAPVSALNGRKRIGNVTTNTFTYPAPGVADGTYTGTIEARRAPLGWSEPHTGTNVAIFARTAPEATGMMLRVLDTGAAPASASDARLLIVNGATGIDTYAQQAPLIGVLGGAGGYLPKGQNNATAKQWMICGNHLGVYVFTPFNTASNILAGIFFGDLDGLQAPDPGKCVLSASSVAYGNGFANSDLAVNASTPTGRTPTAGCVFFSSRDGSTISPSAIGTTLGNNNAAIGGATWPTATGDVGIGGPVWMWSKTPDTIRGSMPGLAIPLANVPFAHLSVQTAAGRNWLAVVTQGVTATGQLLLDLTNSWHE